MLGTSSHRETASLAEARTFAETGGGRKTRFLVVTFFFAAVLVVVFFFAVVGDFGAVVCAVEIAMPTAKAAVKSMMLFLRIVVHLRGGELFSHVFHFELVIAIEQRCVEQVADNFCTGGHGVNKV